MVRMAEREERERRRAEARRYPIDDTELLQELREKAYAEGEHISALLCLCCTAISDLHVRADFRAL